MTKSILDDFSGRPQVGQCGEECGEDAESNSKPGHGPPTHKKVVAVLLSMPKPQSNPKRGQEIGSNGCKVEAL